MKDPNFEFLIEDYPICYTYCKKMDSYIFYEAYEEAAINARKAVEGIVKITDKHFNPRTFRDYAKTKGKYFSHHVNDLYTQNYCDDSIRYLIMNIWNNCGGAAHPTSREYLRNDLNNYAKQTQTILIYFYNQLENSNIQINYNIITGEEEWILEQIQKQITNIKKLKRIQKILKTLENEKEEEKIKAKNKIQGNYVRRNQRIVKEDATKKKKKSILDYLFKKNKTSKTKKSKDIKKTTPNEDELDKQISDLKNLLKKQLELCVDFDTENISI